MEFSSGCEVDRGCDARCSAGMTDENQNARAMPPGLEGEAARLAREWSRQGRAHLDSYLVQEAENPCFNAQSVLVRALVADRRDPERFAELIEEELYYAACGSFGVLGWREGWFGGLRRLLREEPESERLPEFLRAGFAAERSGTPTGLFDALARAFETGFDGFESPFGERWGTAMAERPEGERLAMLELACGSANDYRYLAAHGLAGGIDFTGVDICPENIANARARFPGVDFRVGDAMALDFGDRVFDVVCAFDLFEHLSPEGIEAALGEAVRVCRGELWLSFFNLDDIPCHEIHPVGGYHWNRLSAAEVSASLEGLGCGGVRVVSIPEELEERFPGYRHYNAEARIVIAAPA